MTAPTFRLTDAYLRTLGETAYLWGWPLANLHNRRPVMQQIPTPGLLMGIAPVAPPGRLCMLHDYVEPAERLVACPNQDVAYGLGLLSADLGPVVVQVPDFGDRFWVYQAVDQRSDSFVRLGAMYGTEPGHYVLAPTGWEGSPPDGILGEFRYDTSVGIIIPRVFMDDTDADRAAILPLVSQISMYPLDEYDGTMKSVDWTAVATFGDTTGSSQGDAETKWVDPVQFFDDLPTLLSEVPPRPGEEALYDWLTSLAAAAQADERVREQLVEAAKSADQGLVQELFEFRNIGLPSTDHWSTQRNGASFGTDYLARTAMAKANMFVNMPTETCYYYQDQDASGDRLDGTRRYCVHLPCRCVATGARVLVADPVQRTPLLPSQRAAPLFVGYEEQDAAPRPGRVAHPVGRRPGPDRSRRAGQLAPGARRSVLALSARVLAGPVHPGPDLDPTRCRRAIARTSCPCSGDARRWSG